MSRLTTIQCEKILANATRLRKHPDGGGLYLVARPGRGTAGWLYHSRGGDKHLGSFPTMTPKQAREALEDHRVNLRSLMGISNSTIRTATARIVGKPFVEAAAEWLAGRNWKPKTVEGARAALGRLILATKSIGQVTRADVIADITALHARAPGQVEDVRQYLKRLFDFAKGQGWCTGENPADFTGEHRELIPDAPRRGKKHHAALPWADLPAVYGRLPMTDRGRALRFLILTAVRTGDVEGARWDQIKGENGTSVWTIPETKSGAEHRVPLSAAANELLGTRGAPDEPLFDLVSNAMLNTLQDAAPKMTVHGMRTSFKTWCGDHGHSREEAELSLAHKIGNAVEQAYDRTDLLQRRRKLMQAWADFVCG